MQSSVLMGGVNYLYILLFFCLWVWVHGLCMRVHSEVRSTVFIGIKLINPANSVPARRSSGRNNANDVSGSGGSEGETGGYDKQIVRGDDKPLLQGGTACAAKYKVELVILGLSYCGIDAPCKSKLSRGVCEWCDGKDRYRRSSFGSPQDG